MFRKYCKKPIVTASSGEQSNFRFFTAILSFLIQCAAGFPASQNSACKQHPASHMFWRLSRKPLNWNFILSQSRPKSTATWMPSGFCHCLLFVFFDWSLTASIKWTFLARSGCELESFCLSLGDDQTLLRCLPFFGIPRHSQNSNVRGLSDRQHPPFVQGPRGGSEWPDMVVDLQYWRAHDWTDGLMREMIFSTCLASGNSLGVPLERFRLVYKTNDEGEKNEHDTGLMVLASELHPLLAPRMVEFEISPNSVRWF
ncbi:hypothetical protein K438DRAFT_1835481 [Mycena galopus ATCC 62051]|nr:hypothetical protein K438DRAFT_1835481 [Mycena galopus ATCC 62051]